MKDLAGKIFLKISPLTLFVSKKKEGGKNNTADVRSVKTKASKGGTSGEGGRRLYCAARPSTLRRVAMRNSTLHSYIRL